MSNSPDTENKASSSQSSPSMQKSQPFHEAALEITHSPPLTSSLNSRHSASSAHEEKYLRHAKLLGWARVALAALTLAIGLAILGCEAHNVQFYNSNHLSPEWYLSLWPTNLDLRPSVAYLASAAIVTLSTLLYLVSSIISSPHSRNLILNVIFTTSAVLTLVIYLFTIAFTQTLLHHNSRDTLQSWTCKFYNNAKSFAGDATTLQISTVHTTSAPGGFERVCVASETVSGLTIAIFCLSIIECGVGGAGLYLERRIRKLRGERYMGTEKSSFTPLGN